MTVQRWLSPIRRIPPGLGSAVVAAVILGAIGFLPLFAGPGYESALAAGLLLPSLAATTVALEVARRRPTPFAAVSLGTRRGVILAMLCFCVALMHGLRVGFCDPVQDSVLFLLGGGFGAVMGGVWGAAVGVVAGEFRGRRRTLAVLLALAGPLGGIALSLWRFYQSPMVYAFDPFFGLFAGPLYDTVVERLGGLATYRFGSALTLLAVAGGSAWLVRRDDGHLEIGRPRYPGVVLLVGLAAVGSVVLTLRGPSFGHYRTTASLRQALGRELSYGLCHVVYARSIPQREAQLLGRECDGHLRQLTAFFDLGGPPACTVYLFESPEEKGYLVGAANTHVAKPWRHEVYVQQAGYPHPVLRHELAHVVAAEFGVGPFRVAGPLGGWVPDPGRIEGFAVAAAPEDDADLSLQQWARTMLDLGLLPPLDRVFRLSFLGENSSKAYVVAGAFVSWLHQQHGAAALRRWYSGETLEAVTGGHDLADLERDWRASLAQATVAKEASYAAAARFDRPAIFGRRCPRVVDRLYGEALSLLAANDHSAAREAYERLLRLDPLHTGARLGLGTCALRAGNQDLARHLFEEVLHDQRVTRTERSRAREEEADLDLLVGHAERARQRYRQVAEITVDSDHLRVLELKASVASGPPLDATVALLVGDPRWGTDWGVAAARLGRWAALDPTDGTANYLLGRNFFARGLWEEAATQLDRAVRREIPGDRLRREAWRVKTVVACARGELDQAQVAYRRYLEEDGASAPRREAMQRFAQRCGIRPGTTGISPPATPPPAAGTSASARTPAAPED